MVLQKYDTHTYQFRCYYEHKIGQIVTIAIAYIKMNAMDCLDYDLP